MQTFMGKRIVSISCGLYKAVDEIVCSVKDIEQFDEYTIGVLYKPLGGDMIKVLYIKVGYPDRQTICDDIDAGRIPEKGLVYTENHAKESDFIIGGII